MKNWTIGKRVTVGFAGFIAILVLIPLASFALLNRIKASQNEVLNDSVPGITASGQIKCLACEIQLNVLRTVTAKTADERKTFEENLKNKERQIQKVLDRYQKTIVRAEDKEQFNRLVAARANYQKARAPVLAASQAGNDVQVRQLLPALRSAYSAYLTECDSLFNENESLGNASAAASRKAMALAITLTAVLAVVGILPGLLVSFALVKDVNRVLTGISNSLSDGSHQVAGAATQVSASSQSLAEGASEQAASLQETSSSLEEMSSMTRRNAENAQKANDLAKQARAAADRGVADMQAMSAAMEAIKTSSDDIAKIIKTIDEIAFQTNILALNAAVEAARAGEAGMGFAVVADEVRNLAQRSAQAAKETAGKIEGAIAKSAQGVQISHRVAAALNDIVAKARQVDELVAEVSSASREQSQGITQLNTAVGQMDKVTQSNAANAEESAAAAEELNAQAATMKEVVAELLKLVGGANGAGDHQAPSGAPAARPFSNGHNGHAVAPRSVRQIQPVELHPAASAIPMPGDWGSPGRNGLIAWDEAQMSTGVDTIDHQHQELIQRINELHAACVAGTAKEELLKLLSFLGEYAQSHFRHEEDVMQNHRCLARGQNKAAHIQFLRDYEKLVELVKREGPSTTAVLRIKELLGNWLKNHICAIDASLRSCAGNGSRACKTASFPGDGDFRDF